LHIIAELKKVFGAEPAANEPSVLLSATETDSTEAESNSSGFSIGGHSGTTTSNFSGSGMSSSAVVNAPARYNAPPHNAPGNASHDAPRNTPYNASHNASHNPNDAPQNPHNPPLYNPPVYNAPHGATRIAPAARVAAIGEVAAAASADANSASIDGIASGADSTTTDAESATAGADSSAANVEAYTSTFEDVAVELPMIEFAEVLDQHKLWVESGGESGRRADLSGINLANADLTGVNLRGAVLDKAKLQGADLSMANLRGASLVQANLRDAILLGTELNGANLMGATFYGAEGMWVGRLGGANLFDALLPETLLATFDSTKAIQQATRVARWFYFMTLTISAVCVLLIGFTSDVRLLINGPAIPIPRVGRALPMMGFYLGAPILLVCLYLRFHFLLLRLWGNMAGMPAVFPDGQTLERDGPWYLMGVVRRHFRWQRDSRSPFAVLETVLSTGLAYWVVPATLFIFWLRYLVRQDLHGTVLQVFLLTLSVAAATCLPSIVTRVLGPGELQFPKMNNLARLVLLTTRPAVVTGVVVLALSLGVILGLPADGDVAPEHSRANIRRWPAQVFQSLGYRPYADINEAALSTAPRGKWNEDSLAATQGARLNEMNLHFVRGYRTFLVNAKLWRANLEGAYLSEADVRGANLREATMRDVILDRAQAEGAVLVSVDAARGNFTGSGLHEADLSYSILESAVLSSAKLSGASLYSADMRNAQMLRTDLSRADLRDTKLANAVLSFANLEKTDLSSTKAAGANFSGAQLKGAIFLDADLKNSDLRGVTAAETILRGADLTGANLSGADLRGALGLAPAQVCAANWHGALFDNDLVAALQAQCGGK
jgi:uncharacterized protein YjbI with pentapeptide repeats